MCPPSSWPAGMRFKAVTRNPNHAATPTGWSRMSKSGGTEPSVSHSSSLGRIASPKYTASDPFGMRTIGARLGRRGQGRPRGRPGPASEAGPPPPRPGEGARHGQAEQRPPVADRAPESNHRSQRAEKERRRNRDEIREGDRHPVEPAHRVVAELVHPQNPEQSRRERQPHHEAPGMLPELPGTHATLEGAGEERRNDPREKERKVHQGARRLGHLGVRERVHPDDALVLPEERRVAVTRQARPQPI